MRDLSNLQIHLRDYAGFQETRRQVLIKNSAIRENWSAFATGCFLNGSYELCISTVESMIKVNDTEEKKPLAPVELMEVLNLKVKSLMAMDKNEDALKFMQQRMKNFVDKLQREKLLAQIYEKLGQKDKAIEHLENLLDFNSNNYLIYYDILKVKGVDLFDSLGKPKAISKDQQAIVKSTLEQYGKKYPRVNSHTRIALKWLEGEDFASLLKIFMKPLLVKGAPSVIQDLKEFYSNEEKIQAIEKLLLSYLENMDAERVLEKSDKTE